MSLKALKYPFNASASFLTLFSLKEMAPSLITPNNHINTKKKNLEEIILSKK